MSRETGEGNVLPVEAGNCRRDGNDRRPARDLLHHEVHPVALDREVRLENRAHEVAQRLRPLRRTQHVVIHVLVVGGHSLIENVQVAAHQRVDDLAHREHHASK